MKCFSCDAVVAADRFVTGLDSSYPDLFGACSSTTLGFRRGWMTTSPKPDLHHSGIAEAVGDDISSYLSDRFQFRFSLAPQRKNLLT